MDGLPNETIIRMLSNTFYCINLSMYKKEQISNMATRPYGNVFDKKFTIEYDLDNQHSVIVEEILAEINKRNMVGNSIRFKPHNFAILLKLMTVRPWSLDLRSPQFSTFTAIVLYSINTGF
jgi:hypothetical protein